MSASSTSRTWRQEPIAGPLLVGVGHRSGGGNRQQERSAGGEAAAELLVRDGACHIAPSVFHFRLGNLSEVCSLSHAVR